MITAFACSICGDPSLQICVYCTKDACRNHRCTRCRRCSDCCLCDAPLTEPEIEYSPEIAPLPEAEITVFTEIHSGSEVEAAPPEEPPAPVPEPSEEPPVHPQPDPDEPFPAAAPRWSASLGTRPLDENEQS